MTRAARTPKQIVVVSGLEGNFLQTAVGKKRIRVIPIDGGESFLVDAGKVTKVDSSDPGELPVRESMESRKRATYRGDKVIVVRSGKDNSRIVEIGGEITFLVKQSELSEIHEEPPATALITAVEPGMESVVGVG